MRITRIHRSRLVLVPLATASLALLALAGCSAPATGGGDAASGDSSSSSAADDGASDAATDAVALATADSSLGTIVVDGAEKTVYVFDKDTQGATSSACSGQCASLWPAVHADSDSPAVDGVTGEVGTITGTDGQKQLTLNGWPLYYYAQDAAAGDTTGQGVGGVWWVVGADGAKIGG